MKSRGDLLSAIVMKTIAEWPEQVRPVAATLVFCVKRVCASQSVLPQDTPAHGPIASALLVRSGDVYYNSFGFWAKGENLMSREVEDWPMMSAERVFWRRYRRDVKDNFVSRV